MKKILILLTILISSIIVKAQIAEFYYENTYFCYSFEIEANEIDTCILLENGNCLLIIDRYDNLLSISTNNKTVYWDIIVCFEYNNKYNVRAISRSTNTEALFNIEKKEATTSPINCSIKIKYIKTLKKNK